MRYKKVHELRGIIHSDGVFIDKGVVSFHEVSEAVNDIINTEDNSKIIQKITKEYVKFQSTKESNDQPLYDEEEFQKICNLIDAYQK